MSQPKHEVVLQQFFNTGMVTEGPASLKVFLQYLLSSSLQMILDLGNSSNYHFDIHSVKENYLSHM